MKVRYKLYGKIKLIIFTHNFTCPWPRKFCYNLTSSYTRNLTYKKLFPNFTNYQSENLNLQKLALHFFLFTLFILLLNFFVVLLHFFIFLLNFYIVILTLQLDFILLLRLFTTCIVVIGNVIIFFTAATFTIIEFREIYYRQ